MQPFSLSFGSLFLDAAKLGRAVGIVLFGSLIDQPLFAQTVEDFIPGAAAETFGEELAAAAVA